MTITRVSGGSGAGTSDPKRSFLSEADIYNWIAVEVFATMRHVIFRDV